MNKRQVDDLLQRNPLPNDFPDYQAYLDDLHHARDLSQQILQESISRARLDDGQLDKMLALAWQFGHTEEFEKLVAAYHARVEPNRKGQYPSPFHMACRLNALAALEIFFSKHVDLEEREETGRTALQTCYFGSVYEWLIDHGANVDCSSKPVWTPLKTASLRGDIDRLPRLLAAGANVNKPDREGRSALWTACNKRRTRFVQALLDAGADPNQADQDGRVPLMLKISLHIAELLLHHGADPCRKDASGRSVLEIQAHRPELCQVIAAQAPPTAASASK